jgi:hypothetical protein
MEYAAYLRIVPFAAQNHAANTPALANLLTNAYVKSLYRFPPVIDTTKILMFFFWGGIATTV